MNDYKLTDEQDRAIELSHTGEDLKIGAFAGSGKSSTLCAISEALPDKIGIYLAFNKSCSKVSPPATN